MTDMPDPKPVKPRRVIWWRLIVGLYMVINSTRMLFLPDPNVPEVLKASNETQQISMNAVSVILGALGIWLVISGIMPVLRQRDK